MNRIRYVTLAVFAAACLGSTAIPAQTAQTTIQAGQGQIGAAQLVEIDALIVAIDLEAREVLLKTREGRELSVVAGPEVQRLGDLRVGDRVGIQYFESLTVSLVKIDGAAPSRVESSSEMRAEPTELPGGIKTRQTDIVAKVTAVDAEHSTVTLVGPKGRSVTLVVDPAVAAKVQAGDMVNATYTEALAVSIARTEGH
jgi:hypothetical protein